MASIASPAPAAPRRRGVPLPGWFNFAATIVILALVLTLALRAQNSQPPAVAEFAPQAQQIKQAPQEQTSVVGNAPGGAAIAAPLPSPSPTPTLPPGAVVNRCIGDPPRQIEDPQSPPCVPFWVGDNGGATSDGVNRNQITVVGTFPAQMIQFFNDRFELYGRKLVQVAGHYVNQNSSQSGPQAFRAVADNEKQMYNPFVTSDEQGNYLTDYMDQAAKDHMITLTGYQSDYSEAWMSARAPYIWSYHMAWENIQRTFGAWACARVRGGTASHAGPGSLGNPRVFGLVYTTGDPDGPTDTSIFQSTIGGCGIQPVYSTVFVDTTDESTGSFTNVISNLKLKNVTSVFCICQRTDVGNIQKEADNQSYFPEWMIPTYYYNDANYSYRTFGGPADQMSHVFGITVEPMQRQFQDHPSTWAYYGSEYFGDTGQAGNDTAYHSLLLIASGIQMAGPHLTPYTFQSGLQKANFPNPDSPLMAGKVGFNGGSHAMTLDAAEVWWSMTDQGPYPDETGGGVWCYGHHGARHNLSNPWPAADDLFKEPCDSGNEPANWTG